MKVIADNILSVVLPHPRPLSEGVGRKNPRIEEYLGSFFLVLPPSGEVRWGLCCLQSSRILTFAYFRIQPERILQGLRKMSVILGLDIG